MTVITTTKMIIKVITRATKTVVPTKAAIRNTRSTKNIKIIIVVVKKIVMTMEVKISIFVLTNIEIAHQEIGDDKFNELLLLREIL